MNQKEKLLSQKLSSQVVPYSTEGICVRVRRHGKIVGNVEVGKVYKYYDLASLTKIIFTNSALMMLHESGKLNLSGRVTETLPWFKYRNATIKSLLTHTAGMTWWKPLYELLGPFARDGIEPSQKWEKLKIILNSETPKFKGRAVYSDLDYFLLAYVMEKKFEKPLLNIWAEVQSHLSLSGLHFNSSNRPHYSRAQYAPTESCPRRKRILRGEVHDENTWTLGGVASHAGLFGSVDECDEWFSRMRDSFRGHGPLEQKTVSAFWKRAIPPKVGDWALGYMTKSATGSTSGQYFSPQSIGHTGFTGTSLWYDIKRDFSVLILSNRVYPTRDNATFAKMRPLIHDWCYELWGDL